MSNESTVKKYINTLSILKRDKIEIESLILGYMSDCQEKDRCIEDLEMQLKEMQDAIPAEMLDLVRFLAETWDAIDQFVYQHCDGEALMKYPVVQGTRNQMNLRKIGRQSYDPKRLKYAVEWLLNAGQHH